MDISRTIGEDGSGKDIGKEMKDGGKADAKDMEGISGLITDVADLHLHPPDPLEGATIETAALTAGKACYKSQGEEPRAEKPQS